MPVAPHVPATRIRRRLRFCTAIALALSSLTGLGSTVGATSRDFYFESISDQHRLAQNTVNDLLQDRDGFVWIATQGGLHRYDGQGFLILRHGPTDPASLPDGFVTSLSEHGDGDLWVGSNSAYVVRLDRDSGRVSPLPEAMLADLDEFGRRVNDILVDGDETLWVATAAGLDRVDLAQPQRTRTLALNEAGGAKALARDRDGDVWIGSAHGLHRIAAGSSVAEPVESPEHVNALRVDRRGQLWVASRTGLYLFHSQTRRAERVWPLAGTEEAHTDISSLSEDPAGRLWLGLRAGGLRRFDTDRQQLVEIREVPGLPASLPEDSILSLLVDRSGMLWVGGMLRGVSLTDPDGARFKYVLDLESGPAWISSNSVRVISEAGNGRLWVGLDGHGLKRYDLRRDQFESFTEALLDALPAPIAATELRVMGMQPAEGDEVWVSTNHGLLRLSPARRTAILVAAAGAGAGDLPTSALRRIATSHDGSFWLGTTDAGLIRFDPRSRRSWHYPYLAHRDDALSSPLVEAILEERPDRVWVGTNRGLNLLDPGTGKVRRFVHDPGNANSLSGNRVRALHRGRDGSLWVGTHSGLTRIVEGKDGFEFTRHVPQHPGVARVLTIFGILESPDGQLWLGTNDGVFSFDAASGHFRRYGLRDGLQDLEFNGGAELRLADGRLIFGGIRGLNLFDPSRMRDSDFAPDLVLLNAHLGTDTEPEESFSAPSEIRLPHDAHMLRLRYAALDFAAPGQLNYRYRMDGFDREWIEAGHDVEATYTNLSPGHYVFQVRGTNRDGLWSEDMLAVPIVVVPPWWASAPVRAGYMIVIALAGFGIWRLMRRRRAQERALLAEISEREERLKLALWGSGDEFWDWNVGGDSLYMAGALSALDPAAPTTLDRHRVIHPEDVERVQGTLHQHILGESEYFESEHRIRDPNGDWVWVRARGKVVERDAQGNPLRIAGTARDISASRRAERERRIAIEVLRSMSEAVAVVDLDFRFVSVNPAFSRITGYSEGEVTGQVSRLLDSTQHSADFYRRMREVLERTGHWAGEMWQRRKDGEEFLGWIEISEVCDELGQRSHFVTVVNDITDKKRAEQELRYLANYDTLTGLPNRALLSERLARAIVRARRQDTRVAVLFLDLDRFKDINDSLGHAAGDRILKAAAARLLATVGASDTVARLGGDEFTVVLEDVEHMDAVERTARSILSAFSDPLEIDERHDVTISPSIGISLYPDHGLVPTDLLKFADTAMYQAKGVGRNTFQIYTEAMDAETRKRATMAAALRKALDRGEFRLLFQPRLSLVDGRITGVEALLRWHSADLGEISPVTFIPLAEETSLILPIGEWVLREACMTLKRWRHHGLNDIAMAVNVSVLQLLRGNLPEVLAQVLAETEVPSDRVELEVTESMVMANAEQTTAVLHELRRLGVSIAIDDFGTGYSSLVYLKRLPIDTLKIDKEFVGDLTRDPDDEAITATVITMAHSLGLNVIAEGVETQAQMDYLRGQGCDEIQGYWLSPPLDSHHCLAFMRTWQPATAPGEAAGSPAPLTY